MKRIICIGNQFLRGDDFGSRVYLQLARRSLPEDVQVIDGGIAGLDLLSFFDECEELIFVDNLGKDLPPEEVIDLEGNDLITDEFEYSHASGLGYLIQADRAIRKDSQPHIILIGAGAQASEQAVNYAVDRCIQLAWDQVSGNDETDSRQ